MRFVPLGPPRYEGAQTYTFLPPHLVAVVGLGPEAFVLGDSGGRLLAFPIAVPSLSGRDGYYCRRQIPYEWAQ